MFKIQYECLNCACNAYLTHCSSYFYFQKRGVHGVGGGQKSKYFDIYTVKGTLALDITKIGL